MGPEELMKIFSAFETLDCYFNRTKFIQHSLEIVMENTDICDKEWLQLYKEISYRKLMNADLVAKLTVYFHSRLLHMKSNDLVAWLDYYDQLGLLFEDKEVGRKLA